MSNDTPVSSYEQAVDAPPGFEFCLMGFPRIAHLVVSIRGEGTPGPTLCGIDRFQKPPLGWSMQQRSSDGGGPALICQNCHDTRVWLERGASDVPIHACPPGDSNIMPCCGRTPFEVMRDRMTVDAELVTCHGR